MPKSILSLLTGLSFILSLNIFASTAESTWDPEVIGKAFPIQNALKMMECIPSELKNLTFAVYPTSPDYNTVRLNFNKRFNYFPKAIFTPTTEQEVLYLVGVMKTYNLTFAVRSGGHCFEPGSLSSDYIIDLGNFNQIIPNTTTQEVYIGAGCRLGNVIDTLGQIDYAIPTGTCPSVGVTGLSLGGGIGLLGRNYGLTCDSIKSITLVTADPDIIEVNATSHPDLFWALLGGGNGSYGIVLGLTFQMYYIPEATFFELIWQWDPKLVSPIMHAWQSWVQTLPNSVSPVLGIRHPNDICAIPSQTPPMVIRIYGLKVGSEPFTEWQSAFQDFNPSVNIIQGRYIDLVKYWATESKLPFNKAKSKILMTPIAQDVIRHVNQFFKALEARNPNYLVYFNFESFGGAIPDNDTAFYPRDAFGWWFQAYYWDYPEQTDEILTLSNTFYETIPPDVSPYCYANIVDYDLGSNYLHLYYGDHVERLIQLKNIYDPTNLFHWRQSIPLVSP